MSHIDHIDWNHKRIKTIIDFYGYQFFNGKKVLDLGCNLGEIGNAISRLGANVVCVDARQEHLNLLKKKYPHLKVLRADLDNEWPFINEQFDVVLDLDFICHLKNYEQHLKKVCQIGKHIILESEICDSNDPDKVIYVDEHKSIADWAFNGIGSIPSAANVERILLNQNASFKRLDQSKLNSGKYVYDWQETNSGIRRYGCRRIWFIEGTNNMSQSRGEIISNISSVRGFRWENTYQSSAVVSPLLTFPLPPVPSIQLNTYSPNPMSKSFNELKIAVCLSGHMRTFEKTSTSIIENVIKPTNADVFIHTWDSLGFDPGRGDQNSIELKTADYLDKINVLFNPKTIIVEDFFQQNKDKYVDRIVHTRDPGNVLGMFYKIKKCNEIKQDYENKNNFLYDIVIRCRFDLNVDSKICTNDLLNIDSIFLPKFDFYLGYNDKFAFGTSKAMDIYSLCYDNISLYYDQGCIFNAEAIMKYHFNYFSIPIKRCDIKYTIFRMDGFSFSNT